MPGLDARLVKAVAQDGFGTKMRSVVKLANHQGIKDVVAQQFEVGKQILAAGLVPIIEPDVDIHSPQKAEAEAKAEDSGQRVHRVGDAAQRNRDRIGDLFLASTRVYILAKELGVKSKTIIEKCQAEGLDIIKNHMSTISVGLAATIREWFSEGEHSTTVETTDRVNLEKVRVKKKTKKTKSV